MVVSLVVWALHAVASCGSAQVIAQLSGNGPTSVTGTARDPAGNLYIAGATSANNLPANGMQTKPGGSNLILSSAGQQQLLFPPTANEIRCLVESPQEPGTLLLFEGGLLHRSHDAGSTWTTVATSLSADSDGAAVLHTGDGTLIQLRTDGWLFASNNGGTLWTRRRLLFFESLTEDNVRLSVTPFHPGHLLCGAGGEYQ